MCTFFIVFWCFRTPVAVILIFLVVQALYYSSHVNSKRYQPKQGYLNPDYTWHKTKLPEHCGNFHRETSVCVYQTFPGLHHWPKTTFSWRFPRWNNRKISAAQCSAPVWSIGLQCRPSFTYSCLWLYSIVLVLKHQLCASLPLLIFNRGSPSVVTLSANAPVRSKLTSDIYEVQVHVLSMGNKSRRVDFELMPKSPQLSTLPGYNDRTCIWKYEKWVGKTLIVTPLKIMVWVRT